VTAEYTYLQEIRTTNRTMVNSWYYRDPFYDKRYEEEKRKMKEQRPPLKV
jgi:hypothetical protein